MSKSRDRVLESILERLSTGEITRQEAEEMIGSLAKRARTTEWLFFPMERLPLGLALGLSAAVGVARLPHVLAGALGGFFRPTLVEAAERAAAEGSFPGAALAISGAMLPLSLWFFALLVTGIHTVAGLRGGRLALAAVVGLLVAEVLSKVALAVFV